MFAGKVKKGYIGPKKIGCNLTYSGQIEKGSEMFFYWKMQPVGLIVEIYKEAKRV